MTCMSPAGIEPTTVATMWHVLYPFSQQGAADSCSFIASCAYTWYFRIVWYSCTLEVQCHGKSVTTMIVQYHDMQLYYYELYHHGSDQITVPV